jgi:hypothetical protein
LSADVGADFAIFVSCFDNVAKSAGVLGADDWIFRSSLQYAA